MNELQDQEETKNDQAASCQVDQLVMPIIVQLLMTPNDSTWQGRLLGLGNNGVTYVCGYNGTWEPFIQNIVTA